MASASKFHVLLALVSISDLQPKVGCRYFGDIHLEQSFLLRGVSSEPLDIDKRTAAILDALEISICERYVPVNTGIAEWAIGCKGWNPTSMPTQLSRSTTSGK